MFNLRKVLILGGSAVALAACSGNYDVDRVANMQSKGDTFQKALHMEYVGLAKMERDEADWSDAEFFNTRAMTAANGTAFTPQNVSDRLIPSDKAGEMGAARNRYMRALQDGGASRNPKAAARAQAMFDCWMQEQEENFQPKDIAYCRANFEAAMKLLEVKKMAAAMPAPAKPMKPVPGPFYIFFDFNKSNLDGTAMGIVKRAIGAAKKSGATAMLLAGHTDRAGKDDYNQKLSQRRVNAVSAALIKAGYRSGAIGVVGYGESKPPYATADGQSEALNRRVEIKLSR